MRVRNDIFRMCENNGTGMLHQEGNTNEDGELGSEGMMVIVP